MKGTDTVYLLTVEPYDETISETIDALPAPLGVNVLADYGEFEVLGGTTKVRASTHGYNSKPADDPASTHFPPVLTAPFNYEVRLWDFAALEPRGGSQEGFGDIIVHNGDGGFDEVLNLGWAGRAVKLERVSKYAALSTATTIFRGTLDGITPDERQLVFKLRDRRGFFNVPLSATTYGGGGGLDGGDDLAGKRKPVSWGPCNFVEGALIDNVNLVFQFHDGSIEEVSKAYLRGVELTVPSDRNGSLPDDYASYAELIAATTGIGGSGADIEAGEFATCLAEGLIRLGGTNYDGRVTADLRGDNAPDYIDRTDEIARRWVTTRLGTNNLADPDELDTDCFTDLATDQPSEVGFHAALDEDITVAEALDRLMAGIGAYWFLDLDGKFCAAVLKEPAGTADLTLTRADMLDREPFARRGGLPSYRRRVGYARSWANITASDLAGAVTSADKARLTQTYRFAVSQASDVQIKHGNLAREVVTEGFFRDSDDAQTEANRLQALHGEERGFYRAAVRDDPFDIPLGGVAEVVDFDRLGLGSSKKFRIAGLTVVVETGETTVTLWG